MNTPPDANRPSDPEARLHAFAFVSVGAWLVAAACARYVGTWLAVGGIALVLGLAAVALRPGVARTMLRPTVRWVSLGVVVGALLAAATVVLLPRLTAFAPRFAADAARLFDAALLPEAAWAPALVVTILAFVPVTLGEELVWRGVVQTSMARRFGPWRGVAAAAAAYALANAPFGLLLVLVALAWGTVWGVLRVRTGSLVPGFVAHWTWNALVLAWLSGGAVP